ncbi:hypothetical protein O181_013326 [Austropuccinia psidii MF-1]|uniref:Uncharacterized protein n=1 Tax=Austropuccinia psidii MF-1 TaxID=1389203 RepID=A0A9Q3BW77_9BASI|nr:hypothetical protein [Austropuccinia psidii MF-1]
MLMPMEKKTSELTADRLLPLPFLLSHINWVLNHLIIISKADHVYAHGNIGFCTTSFCNPYSSTQSSHQLHDLPFLPSIISLSSSQFTIPMLTLSACESNPEHKHDSQIP